MKADLEWVYHVLTLGLMLGAGFKALPVCTSNKESGYGRYDLLVEGEGFAAILEFKTAAAEDKLEDGAKAALAQIDERQYFAVLTRRNAAHDQTVDAPVHTNAAVVAVAADATVAADAPSHSTATAPPLYKVGIACFKTACHVETVLHAP